MPWITDDALTAAHAQHNHLRRCYIQLAALTCHLARQLEAVETENGRLWALGQGSWGPLWEENEHLYRVLSDLVNEEANGTTNHP